MQQEKTTTNNTRQCNARNAKEIESENKTKTRDDRMKHAAGQDKTSKTGQGKK
jgi:hypothetical protein